MALRNKILKWLPGVPELPASQTTANEVTMMELLSIRPRSHCSSSSSLGSLDMDPNCRLTDARMFTIQLQSACRRNTTDFDQHLVTQCSDDVCNSPIFFSSFLSFLVFCFKFDSNSVGILSHRHISLCFEIDLLIVSFGLIRLVNVNESLVYIHQPLINN